MKKKNGSFFATLDVVVFGNVSFFDDDAIALQGFVGRSLGEDEISVRILDDNPYNFCFE